MDEIKKFNLLKLKLAAARTGAVVSAAQSGGHRYRPEALNFLTVALQRAAQLFGKSDPGLSETERHLSGGQVLEGVRFLGGELFGHLAPVVFRHWGIHRTEDWGEVVFMLVEAGVLRKTERDSRHDFAHGYDFDAAFRAPEGWREASFGTYGLPDWEGKP